MKADSVFLIGHSHKVCEDYAIHSADANGQPVALIADGCSGSSHTDTGSRLLLHYAEAQHRIGNGTTHIRRWMPDLVESAINLGLPQESLHCTLGIVYPTFGPYRLRADLFGDGWIMARKRHNKEWCVFCVEFPSGAPFYPVYMAKEDDIAAYGLEFGWRKILDIAWVSPEEHFVFASHALLGYTEYRDHDSMDMYWYIGMRSLAVTVDRSTYDILLVASDGWSSWQDIGNGISEDIDPWGPMRQLLDFKSITGAFLRRKVHKLTSRCRDNSIVHYDDISVAGIVDNAD